jgi:hypothetical protein
MLRRRRVGDGGRAFLTSLLNDGLGGGVVIAMPRQLFRREGAPLLFCTGGWVGVRNNS